MFTGIITDIGRVGTIRKPPRAGAGDWRIAIETDWETSGVAIGASIACSGVCLSVVDSGPGWFAADVSAETLSKTTLGAWKEGVSVNLERSLRLGDELSGHLVYGHVDGVATITGCCSEGESWRFTFAPPEALMPFIASKGSIALDGVSLTVNEVEGATFGVNIIPHTAAVTTFGARRAGDAVNVEIDMLARYVARLSEAAWTTRRH